MSALAVQLWPGPPPVPQDGLFAILIQIGADSQRDAARRQLRAAACEALAAVLRVAIDEITVAATPGSPPHILLAGHKSRIGCSFSHDDGYALAAFNLHGPIGADLMRVQTIPDWQAVARDYLGPRVVATLQTAIDLPNAFTQAWTQREAALKYHAQEISEWQADLSGRSISLALPATGLLGHIHIGDKSA
ncbi:4-phosphopantetheinyl transferase [Duganella sp. BuS-21]|uniref:4-phosphopantetheinyl transferase n=1 Tax=Duganella sp. BuS-21 TaxID=2943848 RepID=UPI0035A6DB06